jgi:iron complex outermembrane receptor protein
MKKFRKWNSIPHPGEFKSFLLLMKLTFILTLAATLNVSALVFSQNSKLNLSVEGLTLRDVFKNIEKQSSYRFFFSDDLKALDKIVSINAQDANLESILSNVLKNSTATFKLMENNIVIISPFSQAQQQKVTGTITDGTNGEPLVGVNITIEGSTIGVISDVNGKFSIDAQTNAVLVFSYIGYNTEKVVYSGQTSIEVKLIPDITKLDEVVVVGYGVSSRKKLASAITSVSPEDLNKGSISDVNQLLQGKVPGLNISASGDPNKPSAIVLRGASTLNSSMSPFYVIDGIPGADIATVAPDDISAIDILKDAAATSIYGNRAANGVIIITTKRGKKGQMQVFYNGYMGTEKVSSELKMMDASQLRDYITANGMSFTPADDKGANTNWQKAIEKSSAFSQNHNLSISGGTEHNNYSASINYLTKQGILLNSDLNRIIARLSVEQMAFNDKVKFGLNVSNSNSTANDVPYRSTTILQAAKYLPVSPVKNDDGTYYENFVKSGYYNPVAMLNHSQNSTKTNLLIGSFNTKVQLPFGFNYDLNLSYQSSSYLYGSYLDKYFTSNYNGMYDNPDPGASGHTLQAFGVNGQANRSSFQDIKKVMETYLTWDKKIGDHSINAVIGYSWQDNVIGDGFDITTSNFPVDNTAYNNLTLSSPTGYNNGLYFGQGSRYEHSRLISDFGRLNYNYKDKYLIQGSIRRDGSSVFGSNNQWGLFPSIGGAWRITQESFMQNQQLINDLKLRGSYGVTGNSSGFNALTAQFISGSKGTYYFNGVGLTSAYGPTQAANFDLKWEKTATTNIGLDFTILKGKLSGTVEWYDKKTTGMIWNYGVDPMLVPTGSIVANGGSISNKGIEVSLTVTPVTTNDFNWSSNINLAHNKNEITSLKNPLFQGGDSVSMVYPEGGGQSGSSIELLKQGHPLGQFFTLEYAGKDANGVSQFIDKNGNLTINPTRADYHYEGNAQPSLIVGWSNNLKYKGFDLSVFIRGVFGNKIFNATRADLFRPSTAMSSNILVDAASELPADGNSYKYSSRFIEDGSYIRFDNATLGYNVKITNKYVKTLRVYSSVNNLFVITKFKGIDPEVNQGGIAPGVDYNNFYPKTRTILFGVNVSF